MAMSFFRKDPVYTARRATAADLQSARRLIDKSWRVYLGKGVDALDDHLRPGLSWVLDERGDLCGFMSAEMRPFSIANITAAAIGNSQQAAVYADAMFPLIEATLCQQGVAALVHIGHVPWLAETLERKRFRKRETVLTYGWDARPIAVSGNSSVSIQPARRSDLEDLVALDRSIFGPIWHKQIDEFEQVFDRTFAFNVARYDDRIVGYQWGDRTEAHGHLTRLGVSPEWQGKGVGTRLFTEALAEMAGCGVTWITLNTQESNLRSRRLYERHGFRVVGQPVYVMWLDLLSKGESLVDTRNLFQMSPAF
jgi:ribosomal-protein-alanine N-acetyltransferase